MKSNNGVLRRGGPAGLVVTLLLYPFAADAMGTAQDDSAEPATVETEASSPEGEVGGSVEGEVSSAETIGTYKEESTASSPAPSAKREGWMLRNRPRPQVVELGIYGGVLLPSLAHGLLGDGSTYKRFAPVMGSLGARLGYYPLRWMGFEVEGGGFPGTLDPDAPDEDVAGDPIRFFHVRGNAVFQLPYSFAPFVLAGAGALMVNSSRDRLGVDGDRAGHIGAGFKLYVVHWLALRAEWRGTFSVHRDAPEAREPSIHNEILLGLSFALGDRKKEAPPAEPSPGSDRDNDGFMDVNDSCPDEAGVSPDGCPIPDRDGDGFPNQSDACPDSAGVAPDGCPVEDRDRDGILDTDDKCPEEPGIEPDGCPIGDRDSDQILDPDDKCPDQPETRNGFEDTDGCPDEVPKEVQEFTGVIRGIYFDVNKTTIQKRSHRVLDEAVAVLKKHPSIKLEVVGHTDNTGKAETNKKLSEERANAVRDYLIEKGVDASRVTARGEGEEAPVASNDTPTGRAENRRTEFNIVTEDE